MKASLTRVLAGTAILSLPAVFAGTPRQGLAESASQMNQRLEHSSAAPRETIHADLHGPSHPFPHFWEQMFGSGRAILSLRASYRRDLREVKEATNFQYIRFHGIFDREVGVYGEDAAGNPIYNFSYVDQIYDGLLDHGVRPFVELSFMPGALAARPIEQAFWYHPIVSPPSDWNKWAGLISHFAQHLVRRYGIEEVSHWYFEVWNEPNLDFWAGEPKRESYYHLYDVTARAIKSVSPRLRVGGPATAQAAWIGSFIRHSVEDHVPVDFVSTHVYGNDPPEKVLGIQEPVSRAQMVCRAARKVYDEVKSSPRPELPIVWSEYNASYKNEPEVTDSLYMGPWIADTIRQCDGLADMMSYWTFSDVFEEQGVVRRPLYGGYGLMAEDRLPKPSFNAFKLLHTLGDARISLDSQSALLTKRKDGTFVMALWNLVRPGEKGAAKSVMVDVEGVQARARVLISRLDPDHGSLLKAYADMGSPAYPARQQIVELRRAALLPPPQVAHFDQGTLTLSIPPQGLVLLEFK